MSRITPRDRDRTVRIVSVITGGLTAGAIAATGVATALAAQETRRQQALKAEQQSADPSPIQQAGDDTSSSTQVVKIAPSGKTSATAGSKPKTTAKTSTGSKPKTTAKTSTSSRPRPTTTTVKPKPSTTTPKPKPPPTTTSGS